MNCCQDKDNCSSCNKDLKEKKKLSWKAIIVTIIIFGLLLVGSLGIFYH